MSTGQRTIEAAKAFALAAARQVLLHPDVDLREYGTPSAETTAAVHHIDATSAVVVVSANQPHGRVAKMHCTLSRTNGTWFKASCYFGRTQHFICERNGTTLAVTPAP